MDSADDQENIDPATSKTIGVWLRELRTQDLPALFEFQLDAEANRLAATRPRNADTFNAHWDSALADPSVLVKSILVGDALAGCISCFKSQDRECVGYWIGRDFWGQGVATRALGLLLTEVRSRPLHARAAVTNLASLRVLHKQGFAIIGYAHSPSDDRYLECDEAILILH